MIQSRVLILSLFAIVTVVADGILYGDSSYKTVTNFGWPRDILILPTLKEYGKIDFQNANIDYVSPLILNQLKNCTYLKFSGGKVRKVYIASSVERLYLTGTQAEEVVIDSGKEYQLDVLAIINSNLQFVPNNVNLLKKLTWLDLNGNKIAYVNMDAFEGLHNLLFLDLGSNQLKQVTSHSAVSLPKLKVLYLGSNKLQDLNVCHWNVPKLKMFFINDNQMKVLKIEKDSVDKLMCEQNSLCSSNSLGISQENCSSTDNGDNLIKTLETFRDLNQQISALTNTVKNLEAEIANQRGIQEGSDRENTTQAVELF